MKTLKYQVVWLTRDVYDGHEECVVTRYHPRCWRCGQRCDFYKQQKKNYPSFENFKSRESLNYPLSDDDIDKKYAGRVSKLYLLCEWIVVHVEHHANKS